MKRILLFATMIVVLAACNSHKKELEKLQAKNDSLMQLTQMKDQSLYEFITTYNSIQRNLDSIKALENIININTSGGEVQNSAKDQINSDIKTIYELLVKNKNMVASLQSKLKKSNTRVAELEKMVAFLSAQVEEKNAEIENLRAELEKMNVKVEKLNIKVEELESTTASQAAEIQKQKEELENKTTTLNTAWYAVGTKKELLKNNVINKEGGFLGIGSNKTLKEDFNKDYFTRVDIRKFEFVPLMAKKAHLITKHPTSSYYISGQKRADTLFIKNPNEFWSASKYLVIEIEN
ncbi:MAG: lipoprotein [Bacteroidales bacterium]|jgi:uncharacterized coiled-coil protein SlyX|nr:lipoprotein [Bacteroidales bacterium]NPV36104.1 lipoprotein [Bacteroidales bacterium]